MFRMVGGSLGVAVTGAIFQGLVGPRLSDLLAGSGVSAAQQSQISERLGSGSAEGALKGLDPVQIKQVEAAGAEAFVYALGHAMTVSALVALLGATVAACAIRAKSKSITLEAAEAEVSPGGEALAGREAELETVS